MEVRDKYESIRDYIVDGDVIFFYPTNAFSKFIAIITKKRHFKGGYSHVGTAFSMYDKNGQNKRVMLLESHSGGVRVVQLRSYSNRSFDIYKQRVQYWESVQEYALAKTGVVPYGMVDFVLIGIKSILVRLGLKKYIKYIPDTVGEVCSQCSADILKKAGFDIKDTNISPDELAEILLKIDCSAIIHYERPKK